MVLVNLNLNDSNGEEPYVRLPAPHSHIIITPPRSLHQTQQQQQQQQQQKQEGGEENGNEIIPPQPDIDAAFTALNDERVHPYLESPPYPYKREHAVDFHRMMYEDCQHILHHPSEQQGLYNGCPFRDIRDTSLSPAGSVSQAPKVGDILISRYPFYEFPPDSEQRAKAQAYNNSLAVGHEDLVWGIGCMPPFFFPFLLHFSLPFSLYVLIYLKVWLLPSQHGKGIMSAVLNTLIAEWLIPKMKVHVLKSSALVGNEGSVRVHQKCGFVLEQTIEKGTRDMPSYKFGGGGRRDLYVLKWVRPDRR
jgi:RimJ/RimL family protein N-acetyltransferase